MESRFKVGDKLKISEYTDWAYRGRTVIFRGYEGDRLKIEIPDSGGSYYLDRYFRINTDRLSSKLEQVLE